MPRWRADATPTGFVIEWEEQWRANAQDWYCREMTRCDAGPDGITALSVYCTGDWDEKQVALHRSQVALLRP